MIAHPHLARLAEALDAEQRHAEAEHRRLLALPLPQRVAAGVTWSPLEVEAVERARRGRRLLVLRAPALGVLHEGIAAGDPVVVGPVGAPDTGPTGACIALGERHVEVLVRTERSAGTGGGPGTDAVLAGGGPVAVTRLLDGVTFARYRRALEHAGATDSALRDVLLGGREPDPPVAALATHEALDLLEPRQRAAAEAALGCAQLAVIHGPPGTGKTRVIVAVLQALAEGGRSAWALADSNAAVDHLASRAARAGLDVVRMGHPARIGSDVLPLTLEARMRAGPLGPVLDRLDREAGRLATEADAAGRGRGRLHAERRRLLAERDHVESQARERVLASCSVVACTLGTLAKEAPLLPRPWVAVVDEATQAMEPATWVAVPFVDRLVLVGDPCQLGPVVTQPGNPLERSLLERLVRPTAGEAPASGGVRAVQLVVQHRMHARIQALVDGVYDEPLAPHPAVAAHRACDLPGVAETALTAAPLLWIDTAGSGLEERRDELTRSLYNEGEARIVAHLAADLRRAGVRPEAVGVMAPYAAQVARLRALPELEGVEVATVNAFQGREKEVVICSFVRSGSGGEVGFVADPRRTTVALSRARRLLACVGDSSTLSALPHLERVLEAFQECGAWASVYEEPWARALS